jgi:ATP-binding cassette, subfamily F, member 3
MILLRNLNLSFGQQKVFDNITAAITSRQRIGLFGLNGAGKSTLLKAVAGLQQLDSGSISIERGKTIAYMPQEVILQSDKSILDETLQTYTELILIEQKVHDLETRIHQNPEDIHLIDMYAEACQALIHQEPKQKRAECERMLIGLGFTQQQLSEPVTTLSVGWKMRIVLAQLLLKKADFYLFDEPTNHLDIVAKEWFLNFLESNSCGFLLVCHEKKFLNELCTTILELEYGKATLYDGNYDDYVTLKEHRAQQLEAAYEQQQREIKQMEETINRFRASASKAAMAQSMIKKLDKLERIEPPMFNKKVTFAFGTLTPSSRTVLSVHNLGFAFGDKTIFRNCSFMVERGQRIAIVAPNGAGKTTLINLITGNLPLTIGSLEWGQNINRAVFDQDQLQTLNLQKTVLENAEAAAGNLTEQKIRMLLGSFLFSRDFINKKAGVLSGGERNRLGMVRVLLKNANVLLLDEPTNHLDIPSKDILLSALQSFQGTMIFVSHDQDFTNELATHILELTKDHTHLYHGNYQEYLYQKSLQQEAPESASSTSSSKPNQKNVQSDAQTEIKKARVTESTIAKLEKQIKEVEHSFVDLAYGTPEFNKAQEKLTKLQKELEQQMHEWETYIKS